jgi:hypothetical protein
MPQARQLPRQGADLIAQGNHLEMVNERHRTDAPGRET